MKVERRDGSDERRILIGMIVDPTVLGHIASVWTKEGRFKSKWSNQIAGWCVKFYEQYEKPPGKSIEGMFESWAQRNKDKDTIATVERFLSGLSGEYAKLKREQNSQFIVDMASAHFNRVNLAHLSEALQGDIDLGDLKQALKRVNEFNHVELGASLGVDVLRDKVAMQQAFDSKKEPLIVYPGALGQFYRDALERDAFISYMGPEKRGKCIAGDMLVTLVDGRVRTIQQIVESRDRTPILTLNEKTQKFEHATPTEWHDNGVKECWEVRTRTGRRVVTTSNHEYLTPDGWKYLQDVRIGDFIAVPKRQPVFGRGKMDSSLVRFLAYMIADGGCTAGQATFTKTHPDLIADFERCCREIGVDTYRKGICNFLRGCGELRRKYPTALWKVSSKTKLIPEEIMLCSKPILSEFLRTLFTCDGWRTKCGNGWQIGLGFANKKLTRQVSHLLNRFGIVHKFQFKMARLGEKEFKNWQITIRDDENVERFCDQINFLFHKKIAPTERNRRSFLDKVPWQVAKKVCENAVSALSNKRRERGRYSKPSKLGTEFRKIGSIRQQIAKKQPLMRQSFSEVIDMDFARKHLHSDVLWDEVVSIRQVGYKHTYDLTIPMHHNFIANDCIVHNSWLLLDMAWRAMEQRRKVAFFSVGDLSQNQMMRRFHKRAARMPFSPKVVQFPIKIEHEAGERSAVVEFEERKFKESLSWQDGYKACLKVLKKVKTKETLLRLSTHPADSLSVNGIAAILKTWERGGWVPDVIVIDYADILAPPPGNLQSQDAINKTWMKLRALSQARHCLVVTATQANAASYKAETLDQSHFSDLKKKMAHVTGMIGINATRDEKESGLSRLNWIVLRESEFNVSRCVHVAGCLDIGNPAVRSTF